MITHHRLFWTLKEDDKGREEEMDFNDEEKVVNSENLNFDSTLNDLSRELGPGESLVLDIGNNYFHQTDEIYDTLVMKGYEVRKSFKNGRNQIIVNRKPYQ